MAQLVIGSELKAVFNPKILTTHYDTRTSNGKGKEEEKRGSGKIEWRTSDPGLAEKKERVKIHPSLENTLFYTWYDLE